MKTIIAIIFSAITLSVSAAPSVSVVTNASWADVSIVPERDSFLPGDRVVLFLSVQNHSDGPIRIDDEFFPFKNITLTYADGLAVPSTAHRKQFLTGIGHGSFRHLACGTQSDHLHVLSLWYDMTLPGKYILHFRLGLQRNMADGGTEVNIVLKTVEITVAHPTGKDSTNQPSQPVAGKPGSG